MEWLGELIALVGGGVGGAGGLSAWQRRSRNGNGGGVCKRLDRLEERLEALPRIEAQLDNMKTWLDTLDKRVESNGKDISALQGERRGRR